MDGRAPPAGVRGPPPPERGGEETGGDCGPAPAERIGDWDEAGGDVGVLLTGPSPSKSNKLAAAGAGDVVGPGLYFSGSDR